MNQPHHFDVIIMGGGPAGTCAALRLLRLGHTVALVEKECFPRKQIGESLSPGVWNIFEYLQAGHLLEKSAYLHQLPASVIWETKTANYISPQQRGPGIMVDRSKLDSDLLMLALEKGLHLFQPAQLISCHKRDELWQLRIQHDYSMIMLNGMFILDARGRSGITLSDRILTAPPTIAFWIEVPAEGIPLETRVEAVEQGWLWGSPLPDKQFRVMAFADPKELKSNAPKTVLKMFLQQAGLFKSALPKLETSKVQNCLALMYCHAHPWKDHYVRLGEAAFSLDPLSSTGVEKAMRFSFQAAIAVHTVLKKGKEPIAKSFYEDRIIETIVTHTNWTRNYYTKAWPGAVFPFWKDRSQRFLTYSDNPSPFYEKLLAKFNNDKEQKKEGPQKFIDEPKALFGLWNEKIKVSTDLIYIETACVVDDYLELKTAIQHPHLDRELAYLEQVEIAPLLRIVDSCNTLGEIVYQWCNRMSFKQAIRTAIFLWNLEILCAQKN